MFKEGENLNFKMQPGANLICHVSRAIASFVQLT